MKRLLRREVSVIFLKQVLVPYTREVLCTVTEQEGSGDIFSDEDDIPLLNIVPLYSVSFHVVPFAIVEHAEMKVHDMILFEKESSNRLARTPSHTHNPNFPPSGPIGEMSMIRISLLLGSSCLYL